MANGPCSLGLVSGPGRSSRRTSLYFSKKQFQNTGGRVSIYVIKLGDYLRTNIERG